MNIVASTEQSSGALDEDAPFRVLVIGDFSGRPAGASTAPCARAFPRPVQVDRDNFDAVMSQLNVGVRLFVKDTPGAAIDIKFRQLDDFHPDRIFETVEIFEVLRRARKRLGDPKTFPEAATEMRGWGVAPAPANGAAKQGEVAPPQSPPPLPDAASSGLLDSLIAETETRPQTSSPAGVAPEWNALLRNLVGPHLVDIDLAEQEELMASMDDSVSGLMRTILRHTDFRALEAAWRAVHFLVSRVETNSESKIFLLDVSKDELRADLTSTEDLRATECFRLFVEESTGTLGGEPWALFAGNYIFDGTSDDISLLGRVAKIARAARAPFIARAGARLVGCDSLAQTPDPRDWSPVGQDAAAWDSLRKLPEAVYLGLALPRFLLRLPYGEDTEPTEQFDFEEATEDFTHEHYLWGNPAFACAYLLARAFGESGWDLRPGECSDVEGLPLHVYERDGESQLKPCAEVVLTERAAEAILDHGLMPLLSFRNEDRARLARFQSLADPPTALAGRWEADR